LTKVTDCATLGGVGRESRSSDSMEPPCPSTEEVPLVTAVRSARFSAVQALLEALRLMRQSGLCTGAIRDAVDHSLTMLTVQWDQED